MRFQPKAKRHIVPKREGIRFEDYRWDTPKVEGWHPFVVLFAEEKTTSKGDDMWVITFGVDLPDGERGRIQWNAPETFAPKIEMLQSVLLAELEDQDDEFIAKPKILMFRTCVGLVEIDHSYQRDDGQPSWQVAKIIKDADAEAELGADWMKDRAAPADAAEDDDGDVFGGDEEPPY